MNLINGIIAIFVVARAIPKARNLDRIDLVPKEILTDRHPFRDVTRDFPWDGKNLRMRQIFYIIIFCLHQK